MKALNVCSRCIVAAAVCAVASSAMAATWTGAADACWTNAANWAEGTVPGKYFAPDGTLTGAKEMTATFGACSGVVEIDLDGLYSIGKVHVTGANAPRYTFGTSATQVLPIEAVFGGSFNQFTVDSSVTRAPIIRAIFGFGINDSFGATKVYLYNNSSDELVINDFGYMRRTNYINPTTGKSEPRTFAVFAGTGPITVNGAWITAPSDAVPASQSYISTRSSVGPTFNKSFTFGGLLNSDAADSRMTIADGVTISMSNSWGDCGNTPFYIDGAGTLSVKSAKFVQCFRDGTALVLNCKLVLADVPGAERGIHFYGQGTYSLNNSANSLSGTLQYYGSNNKSAFSFNKIGRIGESSPLSNITTIRANRYLKVVFTGSTPDVTDRVFEIGPKDVAYNWSNDQHSFVVEQAGSASFTIESSPSLKSSPTDGIHKFTLTGNGAGEGIWAGVLADGASTQLQVTKAGTGRWVYTGANTYTGQTLVQGGTLALGAGGTLESSAVTISDGATFAVAASGAKSVMSITASGAAALTLADGAALTVGAMSNNSGTLAVTAGEGASVVCAALAGTSPTWIMINGGSAMFDTAGRLKRQSYVVTEEIAARGDVVPNSASAVVGITSAGEGGPDTLAAASTAVGSLVQKASVPAVISLGGDRTLTVGTLAVNEDGAALTIGESAADGTLAAASSTLMFDVANPDPASSITVNSALDPAFSGTIEKRGDGELSLLAPFTFSGLLDVVAGRVVIANSTSLSLAATLGGGAEGGEIRVDGPGKIAFPHKNPNYNGDFVLNGGTATLTKDDGTVTHFGSSVGTLVVSNGASIVLGDEQGDNLKMGGKKIRISGDGPDGNGALVSNEFFFKFLGGVTLDGDTTFSCGVGKKNPGYIAFDDAATLFDMQEHTLTFKGGTGYLVLKTGTSITNAGPIVIESGTLSAYNNTWLGDGDAAPIAMCSGAGFSPYAIRAQDRKWEIRAPSRNPAQIIMQNSVPADMTDLYRFRGDVTFAPQEAGGLAAWRIRQNSKCNFSPIRFSGKISGEGSFLAVGNYKGDIHIEGTNNTFSGPMAFTNANAGSALCLHWPSSIPDYAKLSMCGGRVVAYAGNWSDAQILSLANSANLEDGAVVAVDTEGKPGMAHQFTLSDEVISSSSTFGLGHEGRGRLTLSGSWTKLTSLASYGGTVVLTGDGERAVEAIMVAHPHVSGTDAEMTICGGTMNLGTGKVCAGCGMSETNTGSVAKLKVEGAKILAPADTTGCAYPQLNVGYGCEPGFMEIGSGAEVKTTMTVGRKGTYGGTGAVLQKAGSTVLVTAQTGVTTRMYIANGNDTWGAYDLEGGSFDSTRIDRLGMANGDRAASTFVQQAGSTARFSALCVGWGAFSSALYYMTGGTSTVQALQMPYINWGGKGGRSTLTIEGGDMTVTGISIPVAQANPENDETDYGTTAIVNLRTGGVLHAQKFTKYNTYNIKPGAVHAYVNFDGGVLSARGTSDLFGDEGWQVDAVTAFAGGAEIAAESGVTTRVRVPISAPAGKGLESVEWSGTAAAEFDYIGMPTVDILGDGYGASAVALFDRASGKVTGIKVTSPGCGYTEAIAVVRPAALNAHGAKSVSWFTNACALTSSAPVSGGLKKSGPGTLELHVPSTYGGATTIAGGTLKLMCDNAIPAGSQLVLAGGTLDLNGKAASFGSIGGMAGTVTGGSVSLSSSWTVDVAELAQGRYPVLAGSASFAQGATVSFVNTSLLDKNRPGGYPFLSVSGTVDNPPVADASLPSPWRIVRSGRVFKVAYPHGTIMIFR